MLIIGGVKMVSYNPWVLYVSDVKGKMDRGELIPDPEWQRGYIWNEKDEQLLIDSILRGLPIPNFYLTEDYDKEKEANIHYAVDGQQRLKAIRRFMNNQLQIEIDGKRYYFKDLTNAIQKKITTYKLNGHSMVDYKQSDINFLFQRLNRTGIKLTNMEMWNSEYYKTNVLKMVREIYEDICGFPPKKDYRDYDEKDYEALKSSYMATIYTEENIKRMLPLDDIIDLCKCLEKNMVEGGSKKELALFLIQNKDIAKKQSLMYKAKFRKVLNNIKELFTKQDLESSAYSKRTHFIGLFLALGLLIPKYYLLGDTVKLKQDLLDFIVDQPDEYRESVLGAIRQKAAREKRVKLLQHVILKSAKQLDKNRLFSEDLKQKYWRLYDHICQICKKEIEGYKQGTLDHIEPWAKGGRTIEANAQLAHKDCNQRKRDKFEEFVIT
jgi:5-methylcytosine-specific restriction endonuclease McrA